MGVRSTRTTPTVMYVRNNTGLRAMILPYHRSDIWILLTIFMWGWTLPLLGTILLILWVVVKLAETLLISSMLE